MRIFGRGRPAVSAASGDGAVACRMCGCQVVVDEVGRCPLGHRVPVRAPAPAPPPAPGGAPAEAVAVEPPAVGRPVARSAVEELLAWDEFTAASSALDAAPAASPGPPA